jgi:hypothetical protein
MMDGSYGTRVWHSTLFVGSGILLSCLNNLESEITKSAEPQTLFCAPFLVFAKARSVKVFYPNRAYIQNPSKRICTKQQQESITGKAHFLRNISFAISTKYFNPTNKNQAATMLNRSSLTPHDDGSRYTHSPHSYRQMLRQKAHDEELRRHLAREVEYRHQLAAEAMQRRAIEEELARRRKIKEENFFRLANLAEKRRQNIASRRHHPEPSHEVVRGLDGRFYRVPIEMEPEVPTVQRGKSHMKEETKLSHCTVRGRDGRLYRVQSPAVSTHDESLLPRDIIPMASVPESSINASELPFQMKENECPSPKLVGKESNEPRRGRVTVMVEDASDSENEDEELNSVWRNRRPSHGEWMEPVEYM